jgi:hypothetical protein
VISMVTAILAAVSRVCVPMPGGGAGAAANNGRSSTLMALCSLLVQCSDLLPETAAHR